MAVNFLSLRKVIPNVFIDNHKCTWYVYELKERSLKINLLTDFKITKDEKVKFEKESYYSSD